MERTVTGRVFEAVGLNTSLSPFLSNFCELNFDPFFGPMLFPTDAQLFACWGLEMLDLGYRVYGLGLRVED